jgi:hypothetical protein
MKISFNDLSLEYGGILDYHSNWDCDHKLHRVGKSADLNTDECLICDAGQPLCLNRWSCFYYDYTDNETKIRYSGYVKDEIDLLAENYNLKEKHKAKCGDPPPPAGKTDERPLIHLELTK